MTMLGRDLNSLIGLSHTLGNHPSRMTLWNEGSAAMRLTEDRFVVTRTGACMAKVTESDMVELDMAQMLELISLEKLPEETFSDAPVESAAPVYCIDAILYAYLLSLENVNYAVHTQPIEINQITSSPRARQFSDRRTIPSEVISCGVASVLVPYVEPGLALAKEVKRKIYLWQDRYKAMPKLILIQNHGMIVVGNNVEEILKITEMAIKSAQIFIGAALMGGPVFLTPSQVSQAELLKDV